MQQSGGDTAAAGSGANQGATAEAAIEQLQAHARQLLTASSVPATPTSSVSSIALDRPNTNAVVGTGQKPGGRADPALLFTTADLQPGGSIAGRTGFGLQRPPPDQALTLDSLKPAAAQSLLQVDESVAAPQQQASKSLWDASVAAAMRSAQSPRGASAWTGFGLERPPQGGAGLSFLGISDSAAATLLGLQAPDAAPSVSSMQTENRHSSVAEVGIGLEKPPGQGSFPAALAFDDGAAPRACASSAGPERRGPADACPLPVAAAGGRGAGAGGLCRGEHRARGRRGWRRCCRGAAAARGGLAGGAAGGEERPVGAAGLGRARHGGCQTRRAAPCARARPLARPQGRGRCGRACSGSGRRCCCPTGRSCKVAPG